MKLSGVLGAVTVVANSSGSDDVDENSETRGGCRIIGAVPEVQHIGARRRFERTRSG